MPKLTKIQIAALALIEANPGQVVAIERGLKDFLTINGNAENKMRSLGLIEKVEHSTRTSNHFSTPYEYTVYTWALTEAGRKALRAAA